MILLPDGIEPMAAGMLVVASYFTSLLTASVGMGGGVALLAAMATVVPVAALVPLHGVVQLGSNTGRAFVMLGDAATRLLLPFTLGAVVGAAVGGAVVTDLPEQAILFAIGVFVLLTTWVKLPALGHGEAVAVGAGGAIATVLTMFIGATGPFVMALMRQSGLSHRGLVATTAMAMTVQHALKVVAFGVLGFAFGEWLPLMLAMIAGGFLGTLTGARLLDRLPERALQIALKAVLTAIGAELAIRAVIDYVAR